MSFRGGYPIFKSECRQYQDEVKRLLCHHFTDPEQVVVHWRAMADEMEYLGRSGKNRQRFRRTYGPEIDIAVGPFATHRRYNDEYDNMMAQSRELIDRMVLHHNNNLGDRDGPCSARADFESLVAKNRNARCFIAVEIEKGNRDIKYLVGSTFNACALARIGVVVAWNPVRLRQLFRVEAYLRFLAEAEKNTFEATNLIILDKEQFIDAIDGAGEREGRSMPRC